MRKHFLGKWHSLRCGERHRDTEGGDTVGGLLCKLKRLPPPSQPKSEGERRVEKGYVGRGIGWRPTAILTGPHVGTAGVYPTHT